MRRQREPSEDEFNIMDISMSVSEDNECYRLQYAHDEVFFEGITKIRSQYTLHYGPMVYGLIHASNPAFVLETGTCQGYLTAWIAKACVELDYRKFYTVDWYNEIFPHAAPNGDELVKQNLEQCGVLDGVHKFIAADTLDYLRYAEDRSELKGLGFVVIDDRNEYDYLIKELCICWRNLTPGGLLLVHNVEHHHIKAAFQAVHDFVEQSQISRKLWFFTSLGFIVLQKDW